MPAGERADMGALEAVGGPPLVLVHPAPPVAR